MSKGGYKTGTNPNGKCTFMLHVRKQGLARAIAKVKASSDPKDINKVKAFEKRRAAAALQPAAAATTTLSDYATPGVDTEDVTEGYVLDGEYEEGEGGEYR